MAFIPPPWSIVLQTELWTLNHNIDARIPGYLMLSPNRSVSDFSDLSNAELSSMGHLISIATTAIKTTLSPENIFISRYGVTSGFSLHFHIIPVHEWVKRLFSQDIRYQTLKDFKGSKFVDFPDGADWTLFIWREFVESENPPPCEGPSVADTISLLREAVKNEG